jgi:adenosylcobinamide hydrolase
MRYYIDHDTLFIRGNFIAASTGMNGGIRRVSTLFNHTIGPEWDHDHPGKEAERVAAQAGLCGDFFGLFTTVPMGNLCVLQYDFITVFVTASLATAAVSRAVFQTINIIVCSGEGMSEGALLETIMTTTEAKVEALLAAGHTPNGTSADGVVVACEGPVCHTSAGVASSAGSRIRTGVLKGVEEALRRSSGKVSCNRPSFFVQSRFGGGHWVEWVPEGCPYYPCHEEGQRCDFCYCPFYPCKDDRLGQWVEGSQGGQVWNCARCTLLHEPEVADYLIKNPEASREELIRKQKCRGK